MLNKMTILSPKPPSVYNTLMPRILIVEDDNSTRLTLGKHLGDLGHTIALAANGWEGLLSLEKQSADLIIVDMVMPAMNGPVFLKVLRAEPRHAKIPVIVMTAQDAETAALNSREFNVAQIVPKSSALLEKITQATRAILG